MVYECINKLKPKSNGCAIIVRSERANNDKLKIMECTDENNKNQDAAMIPLKDMKRINRRKN